ncbi:MAG: DNA/RNA helicase domain-containing protein, partial [Hyphomicrobiales bacterium]
AMGLALGLQNRRSTVAVSSAEWLTSKFSPSSPILDATLSLYGNHDVSAIQEHSAPKEAIDASVREVRSRIQETLDQGSNHIVFISGAPGSGKTLVGLELVMRGTHSSESVFVTGNAPLVEVINGALKNSYKKQSTKHAWTQTGYRRADASFVAGAATYKVVKAHQFLGPRGKAHRQKDGRIVVFDEAQRTYEKGRHLFLPGRKSVQLIEG